MKKKNREEVIENSINWYTQNKDLYNQLSQKIANVLSELIAEEGITIHSISCRSKEVKSYTEKIKNPKYLDPIEQIKDLAGIRVVAYVEDDLRKIEKIIEDNFLIDRENSLDKSKELGIDKVGYKSIHYVARLKPNRARLPEFKKFNKLFFEIQIEVCFSMPGQKLSMIEIINFMASCPMRFSVDLLCLQAHLN